MTEEQIKVPDLGGIGEVIEIPVKIGDKVEPEATLAILESDKATMEIPAPKAGIISAIAIQLGQTLKQDDALMTLQINVDSIETVISSETISGSISQPSLSNTPSTMDTSKSSIQTIHVPEIGVDQAVILDILVNIGDHVSVDMPLVTLESDKASMEIPSPYTGQIQTILVKVNDQLKPGDLLFKIQTTDSSSIIPVQATAESITLDAVSIPKKTTQQPLSSPINSCDTSTVHAGPAVRKLARELGVSLEKISGSGLRQRILKEDVHDFVQKTLQQPHSNPSTTTSAIDFSQWGEIETIPLTRIQKVAAKHFQRSWNTVPHVTQFDLADITELENFRTTHKEQALARGIKLTPLPFLLKACSYALSAMPQFCAALNAEVDQLIYKRYIHIGIAVDTPEGLLVPVIRNADQKGLYELAIECVELAAKAKNKKLKPDELQGGCFTISSLGSIGGTAFTPIINTPELAILGVSKASYQPQWKGDSFIPRLMLPLSLSYDHRAINGADAARFTQLMHELLSDIRRLLL
ncbi:MAG: hypothetical protein HAW62_00955 [Endozoicomonadaceae bacterium]|nr:hypothetical protein [Endozoicomonadaceae bacterium]